MKICIINEFFKPTITGGSEIFLDKLTTFLALNGFDIKIITGKFGKTKDYEKTGNIEIYRINSSPLKIGHLKQLPGLTLPFNFLNYGLESKLLNIMNDADCIHMNNLYHLSFAPLKIAKKLEKPILLDIHDYWPICFRKDLLFANKTICLHNNPISCYSCLSLSNPIFVTSFLPLFFEFFLRNKLVKSENVVVHSRFVSEKIYEYSRMKSMVIPYPFLGEFSEEVKKIESRVNILFMGRLQIQKGAQLLPSIARILKQEGIDYEMFVLGSGPLSNNLRYITKKENLKIKFFGFVTNEKIKKEIWKKTHILLSPSVWCEPFGMVVLEAMASGVPVIGSNVGGIGNLIKENNIGFSVYPDPKTIVNHIKILLDKPQLYKKFSSNGIRNIKKYESYKIFKKYKQLFESMG